MSPKPVGRPPRKRLKKALARPVSGERDNGVHIAKVVEELEPNILRVVGARIRKFGPKVRRNDYDDIIQDVRIAVLRDARKLIDEGETDEKKIIAMIGSQIINRTKDAFRKIVTGRLNPKAGGTSRREYGRQLEVPETNLTNTRKFSTTRGKLSHDDSPLETLHGGDSRDNPLERAIRNEEMTIEKGKKYPRVFIPFLRSAKRVLTKNEYFVLENFYFNKMTLAEIGNRLRISQPRASQLLTAARNKIANQMNIHLPEPRKWGNVKDAQVKLSRENKTKKK